METKTEAWLGLVLLGVGLSCVFRQAPGILANHTHFFPSSCHALFRGLLGSCSLQVPQSMITTACPQTQKYTEPTHSSFFSDMFKKARKVDRNLRQGCEAFS